MVQASWTGSPSTSYVIEYDIGTGVNHLSGTFTTYGNERDFGPYPNEIWKTLSARNPWHARVSPDATPRCWSDWVQFEFQ